MAYRRSWGIGRVIPTAVDIEGGNVFTTRAPLADAHSAACQLAEMCGVDLMDG